MKEKRSDGQRDKAEVSQKWYKEKEKNKDLFHCPRPIDYEYLGLQHQSVFFHPTASVFIPFFVISYQTGMRTQEMNRGVTGGQDFLASVEGNEEILHLKANRLLKLLKAESNSFVFNKDLLLRISWLSWPRSWRRENFRRQNLHLGGAEVPWQRNRRRP